MTGAPVYLMFNTGMLRNNDETEGAGFFLGVGGEFLYDIDLAALYGSSLCGGARFNIKEKPYEFKVAYTKDLNYKANIISLGLTYFFSTNN